MGVLEEEEEEEVVDVGFRSTKTEGKTGTAIDSYRKNTRTTNTKIRTLNINTRTPRNVASPGMYRRMRLGQSWHSPRPIGSTIVRKRYRAHSPTRLPGAIQVPGDAQVEGNCPTAKMSFFWAQWFGTMSRMSQSQYHHNFLSPRYTLLYSIYNPLNLPKNVSKMAMSNNLIFFLLESGLDLDCSVYSLTSGSIQFQDLSNGTWSKNFTLGEFLPAYYVTNCSIPRLIDQINELSQLVASNSSSDWEKKYTYSPYNQRDNGDTFVALLFTISGSCVSCLMLLLLFFLSPKHKRKPILTQFSTIFYTIVTIILLAQITDVASEEYYADTLDIINIYREIYVSKYYRSMIVISQFCTQLAWLQIVLKLTRQRFKWRIGAVAAVLILGYTITNMVHEIKYNVVESVLLSGMASNPTYRGWKTSRVLLRVLLLIWFALNLLYYSILIKSAKICYCKKLLPLSTFIWCLFLLNIILSIFTISLYEDKWLVNIWLTLIPFLIDIYLMTMVWEWIYSVRFLEKRQELMGVLGRRISLDDVVSIQLAPNSHQPLRKPFSQYWQLLRSRFQGYTPADQEDKTKSLELDRLSSTSTTLINQAAGSNNEVTPDAASEHSESNSDANSDVSYDIQYVDGDWDDEDEDEPQEGPSSQYYPAVPITTEQPPPFEPHPGFQHGDYWPDEK